MHSKNPLPKIDHGVDIIGDEWEYEEEENTAVSYTHLRAHEK